MTIKRGGAILLFGIGILVMLINDLEAKPDYDNSGPLDIHLSNKEERVLEAVDHLSQVIGYKLPMGKIHMNTVLLNLYRMHLLSPDRWIGYSRDAGNYSLIFRYNRLRVSYRPLKKVIDGLESQGFVAQKMGYYNPLTKTGKCTRVKATRKLIDLLVGQFKWTPEVLKTHDDEEIILLKDEDKRLIDYDDDEDTLRMRDSLSRYNQFIQNTYIDLDHQGYQPDHTVYVDLSRKRIRRIFNKGSFSLGGRLYGGWWIGIPGDLRLRMIINNQKVAECDYSNMSIHLLYMRERIDYGKYGRDGYTLPDYGDDKKTRDMFKLLLLAMLSSNNDKTARAALQEDINFNRCNYPESIPDLKQVVADFCEYHRPIQKYFYTEQGLRVMHQDSCIAETVMQKMMDRGVPVLPVHDSFICPKKEADLLQREMLAAFRMHVPPLSKYQFPHIRIKYEEHNLVDDVDDGCYYYDVLNVTDRSLLERMMLHDDTGGLPIMYQIKLAGTKDTE